MSLDDMKRVFNKSQKDICIDALKKFDRDKYSNEYIKVLKNNIDNVTNINNLTPVLHRIPADSDIVNYWAYYFYTDKKMTIDDFARISLIKEDKDSEVSLNGYTFRWNSRKAELSFIKHNLRFEDAVLYYYDDDIRRFKKTDSERIVSFTFNYNGVFVIVTVDLEPGKVIRIISFRDSTREEYNKYEGDNNYERLA